MSKIHIALGEPWRGALSIRGGVGGGHFRKAVQ